MSEYSFIHSSIRPTSFRNPTCIIEFSSLSLVARCRVLVAHPSLHVKYISWFRLRCSADEACRSCLVYGEISNLENSSRQRRVPPRKARRGAAGLAFSRRGRRTRTAIHIPPSIVILAARYVSILNSEKELRKRRQCSPLSLRTCEQTDRGT